MKKIIICLIITMTITSTVNAAEVPRESAPCNATNEAIVIVESFIGDILTEVQNGLGYADARAKTAYSLMLGSMVRQTVLVMVSLLI